MSSKDAEKTKSLKAERDQETFVALNKEGAIKYRQLQQEQLLNFGLWSLVGGVAAGVVGGYMEWLLGSRMANRQRLNRYKMITGMTLFLGSCYHGYKLCRRDFKRGVRKLQNDESLTYKIEKSSSLVPNSYDSPSFQSLAVAVPPTLNERK